MLDPHHHRPVPDLASSAGEGALAWLGELGFAALSLAGAGPGWRIAATHGAVEELFGLGLPPPPTGAAPLLARFAPRDRARLTELLRAAASGLPGAGEFLLGAPGAAPRGVECRARPDADGAVILLVRAAQPNARPPADAGALAAAAAEQRLELFGRVASEAFWEEDLATGAAWVSAGFRRLAAGRAGAPGSPPELARGWRESLVHPEDLPRLQRMIDQATAGGLSRFSVRYRLGSSATGWADLHDRILIVRDAAGRPVRMVGAVQDVSEQVRAEEELQETQTRLRLAIAKAQLGFWRQRRGAARCHWSAEAFEIMGRARSAGEPAFADVLAELQPEEAARLENLLAEAFDTGAPFSFDLRLPAGSGGRMVHLLGQAERGPGGEVTELFGTVQDVTDRKRAEEALEDSQERFALAARASSAGLWDINFQTARVHFAERFLQLLGFDVGALHESLEAWEERIHPEDRPRWDAALARHLQARAPLSLEYRLRLRSGEHRWFHVNGQAVWDSLGQPRRLAGSITDIAGRKRAHEALRESEERFRTLSSSAPLGIFTADAAGLCTWVNPRYRAILGLGFDETLGVGWMRAVHPDDAAHVVEEWRRATAAAEPATFEFRVVRQTDHRILWCHAQIAPMHSEDGRTVGHVGSAQDVTERKDAEERARKDREALAHSSRLCTLGEMSATFAHEVNQPLTAIATAAGVLQYSGAASDPAAAAAVALIADQSRRAGDIIRRIRAYAHAAQPNLVALGAGKLLADALAMFNYESKLQGYEIRIEAAPAARIRADALQISQVVINLVRNAIDATAGLERARRVITVQAEVLSESAVRVGVHDRGPGIPPDRLEAVFQPFFTTKSDGLGLGLAICRSIVEAHSGKLWAQPRAEGGASFLFTLPAAPEPLDADA